MIRGHLMAILQSQIPAELQGRVCTLLTSAVSVTAPLGLALSGPITDAFGPHTLFIIAGVGCLVMAIVWALSPTITHLEERSRRRGDGAIRGA
jgi:DHA3 family macrolide efflux protein-like MFS transporter